MRTGTAPEEPHASARFALVLLLLVLTTLAFTRGLFGEFVYDDRLTVERNPAIADLSELPASLARPMWDFTGPEATAAVGYWRPLANVALAAAYRIGDGQPFAFHVLSLLLHLLATWAAFRLARRVTRDTTCAFFAALLFGLHPVHVEAVAWLSAINEPLCGAFVLLAVDAFASWRERGSQGTPLAAACLFAVALLSKELAVAVVPLALAFDVARRAAGLDAAWFPKALRAYAPFALVLVLWYVARIGVFGGIAAGFDRTTTEFGVGALRLLQLRVELLGRGLGLLVWPHPLRVFHPFTPGISWGSLALPILVCSGWSVLVVLAWRKRVFALLWCALAAPVAILPLIVRVDALGVFPLTERYLYVAAFGVTSCVAFLLLRTLPKTPARVLLVVLAVALGWLSHVRTAVWSNEKVLLTTAVHEAPNSPYAHRVLGKVWLEEYRRTNDLDALRAALASFQTTLELGSKAQRGDDSIFAVVDDFVQANVGLGWSLMYEAAVTGTGFGESIRVFELVLRRYPQSIEALTGLGVAHATAGNLSEAQLALEQALAIDPRYVEALSALGQVWSRRGEWAKAVQAFENALRYRPDHIDYLLFLAGAHERNGDEAASRRAIERARAVAPSDPRPRVLIGILAAKHGDLTGAEHEFDAVLEQFPNQADAWLQKSKVLLARGENNGAKRALLRATECDPKSFEAHYNAGALLLKTEGVAQAMPFLTRAYSLRGRDATGAALRTALEQIGIQSDDTFRALATIDADRGDVAAALAWIERALEIDPGDGKSLFLQGGMLRAQGDKEGALAAWKKTCAALPDSFLAFESTGSLLVEMGRIKEAREYLTRALEIVEKNAAPSERTAVQALRDRIATLPADQ
ncbi:MAG: tetratricopeptide repeat protein [Planctomycetes bacterium]|nr:tetratricopeptide repeat protein [Planctomycetota bacterium]